MPEPARKIDDPDFAEKPESETGDSDATEATKATTEDAAKTEQTEAKTKPESGTASLIKRTRETLAAEAEAELAETGTPLSERARVFSGKAGKRAGSAGRTSLAYGKQGLARAFATLLDGLHPARIGEAAQASLLWWHWLLFDRDFDKLLFRRTSRPAKLSTLTVHGDRRDGNDYHPTPVLVFDWAMSALRDDLSQYRFVDYGAGRGRVLMMAAQHPFQSITGWEFAEELFEDARLNIAQFPRPRMECRDVTARLDDITVMPPPKGATVHYFFAPFSRKAFAQTLNRLAASLRESPRPTYLVLIESRNGDLVKSTGLFARAKMSLGARLESFFFSPYRIEVYRSLER